jgi:hypothetical protein
VYLAAGLPVGTSVVESACGSVVKHRMEGEGKRWSLKGAEAMLALRSLKKSRDNDLRDSGGSVLVRCRLAATVASRNIGPCPD